MFSARGASPGDVAIITSAGHLKIINHDQKCRYSNFLYKSSLNLFMFKTTYMQSYSSLINGLQIMLLLYLLKQYSDIHWHAAAVQNRLSGKTSNIPKSCI